MGSPLARAEDWVSHLNPGYFALVMATGIVSVAMRLEGAAAIAGPLLAAAIAGYLLLVTATGWRIARYRRELRADLVNPRVAFGFFTFVAASDVLAAGLASDGHGVAAAGLLVLGGAGWVLLSYSVPLLLMARPGPSPALAGANGTWFIWVVGAQSIAVAATSLPPPVPRALVVAAIVCWSVGVVLYLVIVALVAAALLLNPVRPAQATPAYWVFMGATAISVLAGAHLLVIAPALGTGVHTLISGLSVVLWAFGTWLIPMLVIAGVWRHLLRRVPLAYEPGLWSMVFPVGMYGVASRELGTALNVPWLGTLGRWEAWPALTVWLVVFAAMVWSLAPRPVRRPARPAPAGERRTWDSSADSARAGTTEVGPRGLPVCGCPGSARSSVW